jgi:hypothetical protein
MVGLVSYEKAESAGEEVFSNDWVHPAVGRKDGLKGMDHLIYKSAESLKERFSSTTG